MLVRGAIPNLQAKALPIAQKMLKREGLKEEDYYGFLDVLRRTNFINSLPKMDDPKFDLKKQLGIKTAQEAQVLAKTAAAFSVAFDRADQLRITGERTVWNYCGDLPDPLKIDMPWARKKDTDGERALAVFNLRTIGIMAMSTRVASRFYELSESLS